MSVTDAISACVGGLSRIVQYMPICSGVSNSAFICSEEKFESICYNCMPGSGVKTLGSSNTGILGPPGQLTDVAGHMLHQIVL